MQQGPYLTKQTKEFSLAPAANSSPEPESMFMRARTNMNNCTRRSREGSRQGHIATAVHHSPLAVVRHPSTRAPLTKRTK